MGSDDLHKRRRAKADKDLKRRKANRVARKRALIVCEDSKSAPAYFEALCRQEGISTLVKVEGVGGGPTAVYHRAWNLFDSDRDFDYVLCVFDRDQHDDYDDICNRIQGKTLRIKRLGSKKTSGVADFRAITSWPCFEFWLLLHRTDRTAAILESGGRTIGQQTVHLLKQKIHDYDKGDAHIYTKVSENIEDAIKRAQHVWDRYQDTGQPNPHTRIHELVEILRSLKSK